MSLRKCIYSPYCIMGYSDLIEYITSLPTSAFLYFFITVKIFFLVLLSLAISTARSLDCAITIVSSMPYWNTFQWYTFTYYVILVRLTTHLSQRRALKLFLDRIDSDTRLDSLSKVKAILIYLLFGITPAFKKRKPSFRLKRVNLLSNKNLYYKSKRRKTTS